MSNLRGKDRPEQHTHPAYGMVGLSRGTHSGHGTRLFGSSLAYHASTMSLRIYRAVHEHDLHCDSYFARECIIDIEMSAAQFVEMITNPNVGNGVPCTIRHVAGEPQIPPIPRVQTEVEQIRGNFKADLHEMAEVIEQQRGDIEKATDRLTMTAKLKIKIALDVMIQQLTSNIPFVLEQFNKAADKVVTSAKHEIEQFTSHVLRSAGVEMIAEGRMPKLLAESVEPELDADDYVERDAHACKVCGAMPDESGARDHSRGCRAVDENGGGTDYP